MSSPPSTHPPSQPTPSTVRSAHFTQTKKPRVKRWYQQPGGVGYQGTKKGHGPDTARVRISKTICRILRHDAQKEGLYVRKDGYARVSDLLKLPALCQVDFPTLGWIVREDVKQRFHLYSDDQDSTSVPTWWICANQGHSIPNIEVDLKRITASDVPRAIHGTTEKAWEIIATQGLSRMSRNHIHLAQGFAQDGVISGMRNTSRILIHIDVAAAIKDDIPFYLSRNGVILTPGNSIGILEPKYFKKVERVRRTERVVEWARPDGTVMGGERVVEGGNASASGGGGEEEVVTAQAQSREVEEDSTRTAKQPEEEEMDPDVRELVYRRWPEISKEELQIL